MNKCYGITVEGKVQDIGFRGFIENIARSNYLEGIVFNDKDKSVKMIVRGESSVIDNFFDEIMIKSVKRGTVLSITNKKDLELDIPLPQVFSKVNTDDDVDIGKKLDIGNEYLRSLPDISSNMEKLGSIENKLEKLGSIENKLEKLGSIETLLVSMDKTLQKIAEK